MHALTIEHGERPERWVLRGPWRDEYADKIRRSDVLSLELNETKGFEGDDVEFLQQIPELDGLEIIDHHLRDDSGVTHCRKLQRLVLNTYAKTSPDFSRLERLEDCYIEWRDAAHTVYQLSGLRALHVQSYPKTDLQPLTSLINLSSLAIGDARQLRNLSGLRDLTELVFLGIYRAPRLTSLRGVESLRRLEGLEVQQCKRIDALDPVRTSSRLRRFLFAENGSIPSLAPLDRLEELEEFLFYGSTTVDDGGIRRLLSLPQLRRTTYQDRRHYDCKREEIEAILDRRH